MSMFSVLSRFSTAFVASSTRSGLPVAAATSSEFAACFQSTSSERMPEKLLCTNCAAWPTVVSVCRFLSMSFATRGADSLTWLARISSLVMCLVLLRQVAGRWPASTGAFERMPQAAVHAAALSLRHGEETRPSAQGCVLIARGSLEHQQDHRHAGPLRWPSVRGQ